LLIACSSFAAPLWAAVQDPSSYLNRTLGEDRYLAPYPKVLEYLRYLAGESNRVRIVDVGKSTLDNDMVLVVMSSPANMKKLNQYRDLSAKLANLKKLLAAEARELASKGKVIAMITCSIHSTEVGSTQMLLELAHRLATTKDPKVLTWLDDVILMVMPSLNPDGQVMVIDWYNKYLDTPFEGGPMPWLYHKYVGHDNNRDFYMLTQKESKLLNRVLYHEWYPQVFLDEHQMSLNGPRIFVPPQTNPLAPEIHSLIFRQADLLGTLMAMRLEEQGMLGVGSDMIYDSYWPGGTRNTAWWKNVTGLLTETASVRIATPIYVEPQELRGGRKGLPEDGRRSNYPSPWPGGWWRLRDIMNYEMTATLAYLEALSIHREELLFNFYKMSREAIDRGYSGDPYSYVVPTAQHDEMAAGLLIDLLIEHGIEVYSADREILVEGMHFDKGSYVIPAAQPYSAFLLTMLRKQRYPRVKASVDSDIYPPYDVTSWSLPLLLGVEVKEIKDAWQGKLSRIDKARSPQPPDIKRNTKGFLVPHSADTVFKAMNKMLQQNIDFYWLQSANGSAKEGDIYVPADQRTAQEWDSLFGSLNVPVTPLKDAMKGSALQVTAPRVGLYKPWIANMDEGWTRWLLEQNDFNYRNLHNADFTDVQLAEVDVILFPDVAQSTLESGQASATNSFRSAPLPPEYTGGIGKGGGKALAEWVKGGGHVVALDSSADYLIKLFELPVTNVLQKVEASRFSCPGSMLRLNINTEHPANYGMRAEEAGYFGKSPAFQTSVPDGRFTRRVLASYPRQPEDILLSGYLKGAELLTNRVAAVDLEVGNGRITLIGFHAQQRAQPHRTFKMLFNSLYLPVLEEVRLK
jgi:hypothetical protein